jgi:hypothetical protein
VSTARRRTAEAAPPEGNWRDARVSGRRASRAQSVRSDCYTAMHSPSKRAPLEYGGGSRPQKYISDARAAQDPPRVRATPALFFSLRIPFFGFRPCWNATAAACLLSPPGDNSRVYRPYNARMSREHARRGTPEGALPEWGPIGPRHAFRSRERRAGERSRFDPLVMRPSTMIMVGTSWLVVRILSR